ncbi:MAG: hypothetical protein J6B10_02025 [Lachnospiraceae bacterium]|nr:hypothetical protein [Lachnospiraceae bacterium]
MSYCVNCGVELDPSLQSCPLCNTPVINPNELKKMMPPSPFPEDRGQVETVHRKDLAVLLTAFLVSSAVACALLNLLVFQKAYWSLPIIGICMIIWVFAIPLVIYRKISVWVSILLDGLSTILYLYLLTWLTAKNEWFYHIGIPIVILVTLLIETVAFLYRKFPVSFLGSALYFVIAAALLCVGIEIILDIYFHGSISLGWSAVVLTACAIMTAILTTILSKKRLRNAVRRRLHF